MLLHNTNSPVLIVVEIVMQEENPYQSPLEDCSPPPAVKSESSPLASEAARFVNLLLDGIAIHLIIYLLRVATVLANWYPSRDVGSVPLPLAAFPLSLVTLIVSPVPYIGVPIPLALIVTPLYYFLSESLWARTPAKFVTRTKVVTVDFDPPTLAHILLRSVFRLIPFEAISFMESNPVGWHDRLYDTRVVPVR